MTTRRRRARLSTPEVGAIFSGPAVPDRIGRRGPSVIEQPNLAFDAAAVRNHPQ
jgi:hypothetical protein